MREREVNELERAGGKYREREAEGVYEVIEKWGGQREERSVIKQGSEWSKDENGGADEKNREVSRKRDFKSRERGMGGTKGGGRLL